MRGPYTQLYLHYVWSTWDRLPLITPANENAIYASIRSKCDDLHCHVIALGGTSDHVHLLVRVPATITVAKLIKEVKGASSHLVTHRLSGGEFFKWQGAYSAFTVSKNLVPEIKHYIDRQKEHHAENILHVEWEYTESTERA